MYPPAAEAEARTLQETCLERARHFRETLQGYSKGRRVVQVGGRLGSSLITGVRLLCLHGSLSAGRRAPWVITYYRC